MKKIKIGQIGIGHNHGGAKMATVRKFPELFEVVGYAEENEEWIKKRADKPCYEGLRRYSVDELIDKCDAIMLESDVPIVAQYGRAEPRAVAFYTTPGYCCE